MKAQRYLQCPVFPESQYCVVCNIGVCTQTHSCTHAHRHTVFTVCYSFTSRCLSLYSPKHPLSHLLTFSKRPSLYRLGMDRTENTVSHSSSTDAFVSVAADTVSIGCYLATAISSGSAIPVLQLPCHSNVCLLLGDT
jgi:hypothetical protein